MSPVVKVGRLEELNAQGAWTGRLWETEGTRWTCLFRAEHLKQLLQVWMRVVKLVGQAVVDEGKERTLYVDAIIPLEEEIAATINATTTLPFGESLSLTELAAQQGVAPVTAIDADAVWPRPERHD